AAIVMPVPVSGASVMLAVLLAEAVPPPSSLIATSTANGPLLTQVWEPLTLKPPPLADTTPAEDVPSPQVIVAVKSPAVANGLASLNDATNTVKFSPSVVFRLPAVALSGASVTVAVLLVLAVAPSLSVTVTDRVYDP